MQNMCRSKHLRNAICCQNLNKFIKLLAKSQVMQEESKLIIAKYFNISCNLR